MPPELIQSSVAVSTIQLADFIPLWAAVTGTPAAVTKPLLWVDFKTPVAVLPQRSQVELKTRLRVIAVLLPVARPKLSMMVLSSGAISQAPISVQPLPTNFSFALRLVSESAPAIPP